MNTNRLVIILGLAGFIVMADNWVVSPILPAIAKSFGVESASAGILIAAYMLPFGLFQLVFGPLADRFGKLRVIMSTMVFFTIATALCGLGFALTDLSVYRALTGLFAAATMPVSLALIGDVVPLENRQTAIGTFMGISFLGQALSMGIGGTIAFFVSWRGVFFAYAVIAAAITLLLISTSKKLSGQFSRNPNSQLFAPYAKLLGNFASLRAYLVVVFEGIFILGSFSYLGANIAHTFNFSYLTIGLIMTSFGIGAIIAGRIGGKIAKKTGKRLLIAFGLLLAAASDLLIAAVPASIVASVISIFMLGLGFMLAHSTLLTLATEFAQKARGVAMSLVAFSFMVGGAIGTSIGSRFINSLGYQSFFTTYGVLLVILSLVAIFAISEAALAKEEAELAK
ncbi:MAG: MFS transporter [Firmicutes bacterium]|nr:MFS transporter [Bacillota bacterium]